MKALKIGSDGRLTAVELTEPLYESLHEALNGYFETVRPRGLKAPYVMIVDEDGIFKSLPPNRIASVLYGSHEHGHPIVGDAFIMREGEDDLEGLTDSDTEALTYMLGLVTAASAPNIRRGGEKT